MCKNGIAFNGMCTLSDHVDLARPAQRLPATQLTVISCIVVLTENRRWEKKKREREKSKPNPTKKEDNKGKQEEK